MQKARQYLGQFLYILLLLLTGGQIVLGLLWACANIGGFQQFAESRELYTISRTWVLDEYAGILYPVIIRIADTMGSIGRIPYYSILYVLQLLAAFFSGAWFLHCLMGQKLPGGKGGFCHSKTIYGSLYLMTVPMCMQCHMAVLPQSFGLSLLLLLLAQSVCILRGGRAGEACQGEKAGLDTFTSCHGKQTVWSYVIWGTVWAAASLCLPDMFWIGVLLMAICLILYAVRRLKAGKRKEQVYRIYGRCLIAGLVTMCVGAGSILGLQTLSSRPGSLGRMEKTLGAAALRRIVWPNFGKDSYFWIEPVRELFEEAELQTISLHPERVLYEFGPKMEEAYGVAYANAIYWNMAGNTFNVRTKEIAADMAADFLSYACPQLSVGRQLRGEGVSLNGWNYGRLNEHTPLLAKWYVSYSEASWLLAVVLTISLLLAGVVWKHERQRKKTAVYIVLLCCAAAFWQAVWYTLSASGMQDYKNVLYISTLWALLVLVGMKRAAAAAEGGIHETF